MEIMERRTYPRVEVSQAVLYVSHLYPRHKVANTVDLSLGGTGIETPYSLIKGETLQISIALRPEVIKCGGQVVHTLWRDGQKLKAGIQFEGMSEGDRLYLKQYLFHVMERQATESLSSEKTPH